MEITALDRIREVHIPLLLKRMEEKAADYNSKGALPFEPHTVLGIKGQWADIWRKVWKLHKVFWNGETLKGEQPLEIIDDMIAHLLLTRDLLVMEIPEPGSRKDGDIDWGNEWQAGLASDLAEADFGKPCGPRCRPKRHTFKDACRYRMAETDG